MKLTIVLLICIAAIAFAKGPQTQPSNLSITTDLLGADASASVTDIQSDSLGPYHDGIDSVTSFLTTNGYNGIIWGDWQFGTLTSTTRKVSLSFANPIQAADGGTGNSESSIHHEERDRSHRGQVHWAFLQHDSDVSGANPCVPCRRTLL